MFAHVNLPSLTWHLPNWQTQISSSTTVIQHPGRQSEKQSGFDPFAVRSRRISLKHLWKIVAPLSTRVLQHKHRRDPCAAAPLGSHGFLMKQRVTLHFCSLGAPLSQDCLPNSTRSLSLRSPSPPSPRTTKRGAQAALSHGAAPRFGLPVPRLPHRSAPRAWGAAAALPLSQPEASSAH